MYTTLQKHFHAHCNVISDEYSKDKVQNQRGGQYGLHKYNKLNVQIPHFW